jgi:thiosulfate/3-mercaptopyruvate sulfurtransferase
MVSGAAMVRSALTTTLRAAGLAVAGLLVASVTAMAGAATPLVSVDWLKSRLGQPELIVLDVRSALDGGGAEAYVKAHIPGAVHTDYDKSGWRVTRNGVPFSLPTVAELEKIIGELGIDEDKHVVIVPAGVHATDFGAATRVYWTLKVSGLAKVSILDGGFAAWQAAKLPTENGPGKPSPAIFTVNLDKRILAQVDDVAAIVHSNNATLLDARAPKLFAGKELAFPVKAYGHIPGAINVDHETLYDTANNRLKPKADLAAVLDQLPQGPVVTYCNTGHWASINWFVLSEIFGRKDAKLYAGSMVEWTADPKRPVESARTKWDDLLKALGRGS